MEPVTITVGPQVFTLDQVREAFRMLCKSLNSETLDSEIQNLMEQFEATLKATPVSIPTPFFDGTPTAQGRFTYTVYRTGKDDEGWEG
jgi:hypothetical protein